MSERSELRLFLFGRDNNSCRIFQKGVLPLVISAPHGGYDRPTSIPDRERNDLSMKELRQIWSEPFEATTIKTWKAASSQYESITITDYWLIFMKCTRFGSSYPQKIIYSNLSQERNVTGCINFKAPESCAIPRTSGAYITQTYHSNGTQKGLDAIQIEHPKNLRLERKLRDYVIKVLADGLIQILNAFYIPNSKLQRTSHDIFKKL
ncbi:hypothetical protein K501DRAFT_332254 [Backusella circina FSU 941]|nr:hypothetical protein K501DRAFT_332254 [Backusella circina FSU 941]